MEQQQSSSSSSDIRGLSLPPSSGQGIVKSNSLSKKDKNKNMTSKSKSSPVFENVKAKKVSFFLFCIRYVGVISTGLLDKAHGFFLTKI